MIRVLVLFVLAVLPTVIVHRLVTSEWKLFISPSDFVGHDVAWWLAPTIWVGVAMIVLAWAGLITMVVLFLSDPDGDAAVVCGLLVVSVPAIFACCIHTLVIPDRPTAILTAPVATAPASREVQRADPHGLGQQLGEIQHYLVHELLPARDRLNVDIATLRYRLLDAGVLSFEDVDRVDGASALAIEMLEAHRLHREVQVLITKYESLSRDVQAAERRNARMRDQPSDLLTPTERLTLRAVIERLNEEALLSAGASAEDLASEFETILKGGTW